MKKSIALWMIVLIILLPVEIAYAQSQLYITKVTGERDDIDGYRRKVDKSIVEVVANLGLNKTITENNLQFVKPPFTPYDFTECTQISEGTSTYACKYIEQEDSDLLVKQHEYIIKLLENGNEVKSSKTMITVDNIGPVVDRLTIKDENRQSKERYASSNFTAEFLIKDVAYDKTNVREGVGIKSMMFTLNGQEILNTAAQANTVANINTTSNHTTGNESADIEYPPVITDSFQFSAGGSGDYNLCASAIDAYDLRSKEDKCVHFEVDLDAPTIIVNSLNFTDEQGKEFLWVKKNEYDAKMSIVIDSEDLDTGSVYADLSEFNIAENYHNVKASSCDQIELGEKKGYICHWDFVLYINNTITPKAVFKLKDNLGNSAELNVNSYLINFDMTGPEFDSFTSSHVFADVNFVGGKESSLIVKFKEEGIGMNKSNAYLDLSNLNLGNNVKAGDCTAGWICFWYNLSFGTESNVYRQQPSNVIDDNRSKTLFFGNVIGPNGDKPFDGIKKIYVNRETKDDLNNQLTKPYVLEVLADTTAPQIESINISIMSQDELFLPYIVAGDGLHVTIELYDATPVTVYADATNFGENQTPSANCNYDKGYQICEFDVVIARDGYYEGELVMNMTDMMGNKVITSYKIPVLEILIEADPNYWDHGDVLCSPNPISREITQIIPQMIFCEIPLVPKQRARTFDVKLVDCYDRVKTGGETRGGEYTLITDLALLNTGPGTTNPYLELIMGTFKASFDYSDNECQIAIRSIVGGKKITKNYEMENVTFQLKFYDEPLGEISYKIRKEITGVYDDYVDSWWQWIGTINDFLEFSGKLCQLIDTIGKFRQIWENLSFIFHKAKTATTAYQPASRTFDQFRLQSDFSAMSMGDTWVKGWGEYIGKYCAFVSCKLWYGDNWAGDIQKAVGAYVNFAYDMGLFSGSSVWSEGGWENLKDEAVREGGVQSQAEANAKARKAEKGGKWWQFWKDKKEPTATEAPATAAPPQDAPPTESAEAPPANVPAEKSAAPAGAAPQPTPSPPAPAQSPPVAPAPTSAPAAATPPTQTTPPAPASTAQKAGTPLTEQEKADIDKISEEKDPYTQEAKGTEVNTNIAGKGMTAVTGMPVSQEGIDTAEEIARTTVPPSTTPAPSPTPSSTPSALTPKPGTTPPSSPAPTATPTPAPTDNNAAGTGGVEIRRTDGTAANANTAAGTPENAAANTAKPEENAPFAGTPEMKWKSMGVLDIKANPKDSWILSILTLCIPGIIYNLNKYRQIQCMYGQCLISSSEGGIPVGMCKDQKEFATCKYFYGPLFQLIPFAGFLDQLSNTIKNIMANPLLMVDTTFYYICKGAVAKASESPSPLGTICIIHNSLDLAMDIWNDIEQYKEKDFWKFGGEDACDTFKKAYDENFNEEESSDDEE